MSFICSSSADTLKFQNSVYYWSLGIAAGDFQKSSPSYTFFFFKEA